jgi:hypothetical protein
MLLKDSFVPELSGTLERPGIKLKLKNLKINFTSRIKSTFQERVVIGI